MAAGNVSIKNNYLPLTRVHILGGAEWGTKYATDYWLCPSSGLDIFAAANTATGDELAENGWTSTSLVNTAGGGSDMFGGVITPTQGNGVKGGQIPIPSDMGTPQHALTDASGDLLGSPSMLGDYVHAYAAMRIAGKNVMPRYLILETVSAFTVNSADEDQSAFGLYNAAATISVEATQYAVIASNGTNFVLSGAGVATDMATGPLVDTSWHHWRIVLQFPGGTTANAAVNVFAYIDGVIFSTTPGTGVQDQFPLRFGFHALTTNRIGMGMVHAYYDW